MVSPSIDGTDELWACGGAVIERYVEPRHVQAVLDKKAEKHDVYAQKCDSVWLLIVNGGAIRTVPCELEDYAETLRIRHLLTEFFGSTVFLVATWFA